MLFRWRKKQYQRGGPVNPYEAVGRFINAYYYYNLTSMFGDVPLTDALQAPANLNAEVYSTGAGI